MLETVKTYIHSISDASFSQFYSDYVLSVVDTNIQHELKHIRSYGFSTFEYDIIVNKFLDKLVNSW